MAYSDRELLARLIECEAGGEGENGMKAVASVVMNRVRSTGGEYARVGQGSIRNIIFQPYQFVCASETEGGAYNPQNIYNMRPEQIPCGFTTPSAPPAGPSFPRRWDTGRPGSATTASIIPQTRIIRLERCWKWHTIRISTTAETGRHPWPRPRPE